MRFTFPHYGYFPALAVLLRFQAVGFEFAVEVGAFQADLFGQQADVAPAFLQFAPQELFFKQGPGLPEQRRECIAA